MTTQDLKSLFARHVPNEEQSKTMAEVRRMALELAGTMLVNSPASAEQTIAIRKVHESLMYFNLAMSLPAPVVK